MTELMLTLYRTIIICHIAAGAVSLILFWVPVVSKKGSCLHIQAGKGYVWFLYFLTATGFISSLMVIADPQLFKPGHFARTDDVAGMTEAVRRFWLFLIYLCLLVLTNVRHAVMVLKAGKEPRKLLTNGHVILPVTLTLASFWLFYSGMVADMILFKIFACIGGFSGIRTLLYCLSHQAERRDRMKQHISHMLGSGIGIYTAFLAFGGRALLDVLAKWQVVFWVLPSVVGTLGIVYAVRRFTGKSARRSVQQ